MTELPAFFASIAAASPANPEPITITSVSSFQDSGNDTFIINFFLCYFNIEGYLMFAKF
jgi:hypothetical protein